MRKVIWWAATLAFGAVCSISHAATLNKKFRDCSECPEMVVIPAGTYMMGSPETDDARSVNETPQHRVTIARRFAIGAYDVTRNEYAAFVRDDKHENDGGCYFGGKKDDAKNWRNPGYAQTDRDPAVCVSWDDAKAYIDWLNKRVGRAEYRLPTEAEWEYAARAGTLTRFPWGDELNHELANFGRDQMPFGPYRGGQDRWEYSSPVGSFPPNAFGLYDMIGNVAQWVEDCRHQPTEDYTGAPTDGSAWHQDDCNIRTLRGGAWDAPPRLTRVTSRAGTWPYLLMAHVGFRVAKTLE